MQPDTHAPPLTRWDHVWRLALVLLISGVAWWDVGQEQLRINPLWFVADGVVGVICLVLLVWRRRYPVTINVVINLLSMFSASTGGPATLALVSLATRRRWLEIVPIGLLSVVCGIVQTAVFPLPPMWIVTLPFLFAIVGVTTGWGLYIGSRRELLANLRERVARAESEQSARVAQGRSAERARIAREMHDVMAHRISLVTMHAGALAFRDDLDAAQVKRTAITIQQASHQALAELREVLGVLRDEPGDAAPERPQPAGADLVSLIDEARSAGGHVELDVSGDPTALPDTLGRTVYRLVQEALTNARKHAPHASVVVSVTAIRGQDVTVRVSNPLAVGHQGASAPGAGLGLVGLAERVSLLGGQLDHRLAHGTFIVEARLPWPDGAAEDGAPEDGAPEDGAREEIA